VNYILHLLIYLDIYVIVALGLNLLVGYCGLLTLAHAAFFAVGGYTYALLSLSLGWGFIPATLASAVAAGLFSLAVSVPAWRLRGDLFVLATLAVQTLIFSALYNWSATDAPVASWRNLTNGPFGITGIPRPMLLGWAAISPTAMAAVATFVAGGCSLAMWRLTTSPWARLLLVMRDDELAARGLGKDTRLAKVQAVAIASGFAAVAGAVYSAHVGYLDPTSASLTEGIAMISMVIVGGLANFRGPLVGATVLVALPELLRFMALPDAQAANLRLLIYGVLLVLIVHFRPQGIAGVYRVQ
jgi:branched-chain amino acid transport system permease protein